MTIIFGGHHYILTSSLLYVWGICEIVVWTAVILAWRAWRRRRRAKVSVADALTSYAQWARDRR